jgi:acyl-coenzyme A synthetase/AMP-(fatty) acid ligase
VSAADHVRRTVRERPDAIFLIEPARDISLTYEQTWKASGRLAARLREMGVGQGDRVAIALPNGGELACAYLACSAIGALAVPLDVKAHESSIAHIVGSTTPKVIITGDETDSSFTALEVSNAPSICITLSPANASPEAQDITGGADSGLEPFPHGSDDKPWSVTHTSGTTSAPKGVVHSARTLLGNALAFEDLVKAGPDSRFIDLFQMSYMAGFLNSMLCPLVAGGSVVIEPAFGPMSGLRFWSGVKVNGVTHMWLSPTMIRMVQSLDRDPNTAEFVRTQVKGVYACTAPLAAEDKQAFESWYGVPVRQSYGTSEQLILTLNDVDGADSGVGKPLDGVDFELRDDDGVTIDAGSEGEIFLRTQYEQLGYYGPEYVPDGEERFTRWIKTGDVGEVTADGALFITGRKKDLIIKGGANISPEAVESVALSEDSVAECAAVGIPDATYGEVVGLAVLLQDGVTLAEAKPVLAELFRAGLSANQRPTYLMQFDELPRTSNGKVLRRDVKSIFSERLSEAETLR